MSNKMLIDASHPEETRVAVVRGNRIEEFDFESQEKKQLRGNIYLAKVTRVEPSLQAAFIDYGGNRHGFLAFSEIHPDYYQIPVADRQALLEAEAAEARAQREAEEAEDDAAPDLDLEAEADDENADEDEVEAKPRQRRPRTRRGRKAKDNDSSSDDGNGETDEAKDGDNQTEQAATHADELVKSGATAEVATNAEADKDASQEDAKPKRRSTRRKAAPSNKATGETGATADETTAEKIATEASETEAGDKPAKPRAPRRTTSRVRKKVDNESEAGADQLAATSQTDAADDVAETADENSDKPSRTISAMIETESVSEPLPGEDDSSHDGPSLDEKSDVGETSEQPLDTAGETGVEAGAETKPEKAKPKRARKPRKKAAEKADTETGADDAEQIEAESADPSASDGEEPSEVAEKPKRKPRRTRKAKATEETDGQSEGEESGTDDNLSSDTASEETGDTETVRAEKTARAKSRRGRKKSEPEGDFEDHDDSVVETVGSDDEIDAVAPPTRFRKQYKIQEVIKRRQVMLIQVVKEERGNKGAALTTYLSLAGRYSVLMPNTARGGGISRKITNSVDRKRLKAIANELDVPKGMGVILRTAGASRTKDEVERDFQYLMRLWEQVRNLTLASSAPCLVYEEGSLIKRSIRDLYNKETSEILVAGEEGYREARDFMEMLLPDQVDRVKQYSGSQAIFARYGVEAQLDAMVTPQVTLKSGGYLVINQTEALVAVDVNSGRATREHSVEKTALQTNLEAAEEVARQLRLRDLAGLIVIDFIDMEERRNNRAVEKKLKDCLKNDRARIQVGRISHFGLMEMSRQRIRASVLDSTMNVCPHCAGVGHVRSESAIALHVFRALEEHVTRNRGRNVVVQTTPKIADHMLNHKRSALVDLEKQYGIQVVISGNSAMVGQEFHIEKGDKVYQNGDDVAAIGIDTDNVAEADPERVTDNKHRRNAHSGDDVQKGERKFFGHDDEKPEDEDDPDKPRKKRRRRKRGGRKNREGGEETSALPMSGDADDEAGLSSEAAGDLPDTAARDDAADGSTQATKATPPTADAATSSLEPDEAEALSDDAAPKRTRSTRRKKAPIAPPVEVAVPDGGDDAVATGSANANGVDSEGESMTASAPARPKRRTTRRKRADEADSEEVSGESSSAIEDAGVEPVMGEANGSDDTSATPKQPTVEAADTSESTASEGEADETGAKPKRSWWSRGTGFF